MSNKRPDIYLDEFEHFDVIVFNKHEGFAIDAEAGALLLFFYTGKTWTHTRYAISDIRGFAGVEGQAEIINQMAIHGRGMTGAVEAAGRSVGDAIVASRAKRKAEENTGIAFRLRSVERPEFRLQIPVSRRRTQIIEAVNQALEGSKLATPYRELTAKTKKAFQRPSQQILDQEARLAEECASGKPPSLWAAIFYTAAAIVGLIAVIFVLDILG